MTKNSKKYPYRAKSDGVYSGILTLNEESPWVYETNKKVTNVHLQLESLGINKNVLYRKVKNISEKNSRNGRSQ